ncbi:MAG: F-box domain protein [Barrevirus sp.]|uniref:F-box domain protein n=1 Tax=Barrevirus sp. TaxID=2487763 RepID=A0A3G4ZS36_9VIRU|nr:MAG: F-box domain protein [Barrevirus sp.]
MDALLPDILSIIYEFIDTKQLIWASRTCRKWHKVYHDNLWKYKIDVTQWSNKIKDKHLESFKNVRTINLKSCYQIEGPGLKHLDKAINVDLSYCKIIGTDLILLKSVKTLNVRECSGINDYGLEQLATFLNIEAINIYGCSKITIDGLNYIRNVPSITMCACNFETNALIDYVNKYKNVSFQACSNYSFDRLQLLKEQCPSIFLIKDIHYKW